MRSLNVYVDDTLVGTLSEGNNLWVFDYDPAWIAWDRSFDLSPALARSTPRHEDGGTMRPVQWYFDNLLPEELLRTAVAKEAIHSGLAGLVIADDQVEDAVRQSVFHPAYRPYI